MAAFASAAELASYLQVPSVDTSTANLVLDIASARIREECGWSITQETGVTKTLDSYGRQSVWLKTRLLTAVTSVVEKGVTLTNDTHYRWWENGRLERLSTCWPDAPRSVAVVFSHGYTSGPDDVKGACLALASGRYTDPLQASSYTDTVGAVTESRTFAASSVDHLRVDDPQAVINSYALVM